jgi:hypothetical protein
MPPRLDPPPHEAIDHVGMLLTCQGELLLGLEADDGLVQQHVVEHRAERVVGVVAADGVAHRVGDGGTERPGMVGVVDRRRHDRAAPVSIIILR